MGISVVCQCGKTMSAPDEYAGRKGKCKACGAVVQIPAAKVFVSAVSLQPITRPEKDPDFPKADREPSPDEPLYEASPSMFRNRPVRFVLSLFVLAVTTLIAFTVERRPGQPLWPFLVIPGLLSYSLVVWYLRCRNTRLTITRRKAILRRGILSKALNEVRICDVRNIMVRQGFLQRLFEVGAVGISTSGQSGVEIEVEGIPRPNRVREIIDEYRG